MRIFQNLSVKHVILQGKEIGSLLYKTIQHTGPLTVFNFMRDILTNTNNGYYMKKDIFGTKGDFITSPEISQMFGELCGLWVVNEWMSQNKPVPFNIIELGPGRGTLMSDAIKAMHKFPDFITNVSVSFVEISHTLKVIQEDTIGRCLSQLGLNIPFKWFDNLNKVPRGMVCGYLAHEFFDVLPVHKFKRITGGNWREILIDVIKSDNDNVELGFVISKNDTPATVAFKNILDKNPHLNDMEISPVSATIIDEIGERISESGGFGLIADYGHNGEKGDTFRAYRRHQVTDPLKNIGESDLTADVNFKFLVDRLVEKFPKKLMINGPVKQSDFLKNMGIDTRLQMLLNGCKTRTEVDHLLSGYRIMMSSEEMGERFKFLSLSSICNYYPENYIPAGFCTL